MKAILLILVTLTLNAMIAMGAPVISEFMASNFAALEDDQGEFSDWIEIHNPDGEPLGLGGWSLTDDPAVLQKWTFPSQANVAAGDYIVVYASGRNVATLFAKEYHTNFSLNDGGEYLALVNPEGEVVHEYGEEYPEQYTDVSYGLSGDAEGYLTEATPGAANAALTEPPLKKVKFSSGGKTFFDSIEVELTHEDPEAEIRYTLDGSEPTLSLFDEAALYEGPITIDSTARLRARAYKDDALPGEVASKVFIQLGEDMRGFETNLALCVLDSFGTNVDNLGKAPLTDAAAVFIDTGGATGMAVPDGEVDWSGPIGIRLRGQSSLGFAKKQYHFESWDELDRDKAVSIFGMPEESDWIIHAPYADKTLMRNYLSYRWSRNMGHYAVREKYMEVFYNPTEGQPVTRDDYRGVYVFMERIKRDGDRVDVELLEPAHDSEPEITGGYIFRKDKEDQNNITIRTSREGQVLQIIEPEFTLTDKQKNWLTDYMNEFEDVLHGPDSVDPENGFRKYVNEANAIDNHLLVEITKNIDGYRLSNYVYKYRGGKMNFVAWDYNLSLGNADYLDGWKPEGWYYRLISANQYPWYGQMFEDPEFALSYADRWFALRRGMFGTEALMTEIDDLTDYLREAADRNFERWPRLGVYDWPNAPGFQDRKTYQDEVDFMKDWLRDRVEWMDTQFELPVKFSQQGGQLAVGTELTMDNKVSLFKPRPGKMYYTFDGSDPRLPGGEVNPEAHLYEGGVPLTESVTVKARLLLNTGDWSALNEANFIVGTLASAANLRVTEIMYNPSDPTPEEEEAGFTNNDDFEWLELLNIGDETIQLAGAQFIDGINFDFTDGAILALEPGERGVLVGNEAAFAMRYGDGLPVIGTITSGRLSNGGETLKLLSADGESVITEFAYDDDAESGWPQASDGEGYSLVLVNETGSSNLSESSMWRQSVAIHGSPGAGDGDGEPVPVDGDFHITGIDFDGDLTITFNSEPGASYEIQVSDNLSQFTPVGDVDGAGETTSYKVTVEAGMPLRFVRVAKK